MANEKLTYEEAIGKLEDIVNLLEEGDISLEKSINLFTEGMDLVKTCNKYLDQAENKIKILVEDKTEDFAWPKEE